MCQCKNSVKIKLLEMINSNKRPINVKKLINKTLELVREELDGIDIDNEFIKIYIKSIITEMIKSKMINNYYLRLEDKEREYFYLKLNEEISLEDKLPPSNKEEKVKQMEEETKERLIDELISLKKKLAGIKIHPKTKELHNEIHKYNEIKDVAQELLGHIASHKNKMVKDLYAELEISDDDNK